MDGYNENFEAVCGCIEDEETIDFWLDFMEGIEK